jgi:hypothetical protein
LSAFVFVAITLVIGAACVALAWGHVVRVEGAASGELRSIAAAIRKAPAEDRVRELAKRAPRGGFEEQLAGALLSAEGEGERARVAAVNEALSEVERALSERQKWPAAAARIAAWGSMLVGVASFLEGARAPIVAIAGIGGASVIACLGASRRAERAARDRREAVDALITALLGRSLTSGEARLTREAREDQRGPLPIRRRRVR